MFSNYLLLVLLPISWTECMSIIDRNDTALEYLNNCKCVLDIQCLNGVFNVGGVGIISIRNNADVKPEGSPIKCSKPGYVCCRAHKKENVELRIDSRELLQETKADIANSSTNLNTSSTKYRTNESCGKPKPTFNIRLSNPDEFSEAIDGEFPWMVSIFRRNSGNQYKFRCAGSLISDSVILTAAHCLYSGRKKPSEFKILANAKAELVAIGSDVTQERAVEKIIIHPDYYAGAGHNDIALISVSESFGKNRKLNNICLPDLNVSYDNTRCLAAGWGSEKNVISAGNKILKKIELPIVERTICENLLKKTHLGKGFELHESFICAGGQRGKDTCKGDGGGPLICPNDEERYIQVGIVSWGVDCAQDNRPGVYTDVAKFSKWISSNINQ